MTKKAAIWVPWDVCFCKWPCKGRSEGRLLFFQFYLAGEVECYVVQFCTWRCFRSVQKGRFCSCCHKTAQNNHWFARVLSETLTWNESGSWKNGSVLTGICLWLTGRFRMDVLLSWLHWARARCASASCCELTQQNGLATRECRANFRFPYFLRVSCTFLHRPFCLPTTACVNQSPRREHGRTATQHRESQRRTHLVRHLYFCSGEATKFRILNAPAAMSFKPTGTPVPQ